MALSDQRYYTFRIKLIIRSGIWIIVTIAALKEGTGVDSATFSMVNFVLGVNFYAIKIHCWADWVKSWVVGEDVWVSVASDLWARKESNRENDE